MLNDQRIQEIKERAEKANEADSTSCGCCGSTKIEKVFPCGWGFCWHCIHNRSRHDGCEDCAILAQAGKLDIPFLLETIESLRQGGWITVSSGELPNHGETVLMWFVTVDPRNSGPVLGSLSLHESGKYWDCGGLYRDFSHISHWRRIKQPAPLSPGETTK